MIKKYTLLLFHLTFYQKLFLDKLIEKETRVHVISCDFNKSLLTTSIL